ncbi:MAG: cytochrome c [Ignavibacteria bacterium]|nr:cytochrome c [Ignavibacteria bacterium]
MKKYLRFYGIIYILILALIIGLGMLYLNNINTITINKITPPVFNTITVKQDDDLPYVKGSMTPPIEINKFASSTPELTAKGKGIYKTQCLSCHGEDGKGDGIAGVTLNPKPRNFQILEGWTNTPDFKGMYKTLQEGVTSRGMASYSNLPPEDRFALIHYVRTFSDKYPKITDEELTELETTYSLSKGLKTPNQIPVSVAEDKLIEKYKVISDKIKNSLISINENKNDKGAILLKENSGDLKKVLTSLYNYKNWNESENQFISFVNNYTVQKGFKSTVTQLNPDEWTVLFQYLKNSITL